MDTKTTGNKLRSVYPDLSGPRNKLFRGWQHGCLIVGFLANLSVSAQEKVEPVPLALDQAIAQALEHNLDIAIQRESIYAAEAGVLESLGAFDPSFSSGYSTSEDERPLDAESATAAAGLTRVRTESESANLNLSGQTPLSTRYSLGAQDRSSADTFNEFEDEHVFSASVTLTQPLLRGRGKTYATYGVRLSRRNLRISQLDFRVQVERILIDVEKAYWDLIRAEWNLAVRQKSVDAAESLLKQVEIKRDVATASEADRIQAQSGLAQRELTLLEARRQRSQQDRALKHLVLKDLSQPTPPFDPIDRPDTNRVIGTRQEVLQEALAQRPEMKKTQIELKNAREAVARAENDQRPQVDLEAGYGLNGLGGSFGNSFESARSGDDNNWSIGLVYRKTWPDRRNRGAVQRQESALRSQQLRTRQVRRGIILETDDLFDRLNGVLDQIRAGKPAVSYARLNLENERTKFEVQKSTVHNILLLEAELLEVELNLDGSRIEQAKILAELERVKGTLLERWGIQLE